MYVRGYQTVRMNSTIKSTYMVVEQQNGRTTELQNYENYKRTIYRYLQNYRTTELQNYRTTELQNYRTTELQNFLIQVGRE